MNSQTQSSSGEFPSFNTKTTGIVVVLFACAFGVMFLARNALGLLTPHIAPALHLEPRHLGALSAVLAIGWSLSGWLLPRWYRHRWDIQKMLAALLIVLAIDCIATSLINGFVALLICRAICGATGGPALPFIQEVVARNAVPHRRGLYMGIVHGMGGSLIAAIIGPIAVVSLAQRQGWRADFLVLAMVSLLLALVISKLPVLAATSRQILRHDSMTVPLSLPNTRNIILCCLVGGLMVAWLVLATTFFPLYLVTVKRISDVDMSLLMSVTGIGGFIGAIFVPYLSDHCGRRATLVAFAILGVVSPAAILIDHLSLSLRAALLLVGGIAGGTFPLFLAIIPAESVSRDKVSVNIGIVQATSELIGGVFAPMCVGWLADRYGLQLPVVITLCSALLAGVLATGIRSVRNNLKHLSPSGEIFK